jgi:hypothetical protein
MTSSVTWRAFQSLGECEVYEAFSGIDSAQNNPICSQTATSFLAAMLAGLRSHRSTISDQAIVNYP